MPFLAVDRLLFMTFPLVRRSPASTDHSDRVSPFGVTYHKKAALPRVADGDEPALATRVIRIVESHSNRTTHLLASHQALASNDLAAPTAG